MIKDKRQRVRWTVINLGKIVFRTEEVCCSSASKSCSVALIIVTLAALEK